MEGIVRIALFLGLHSWNTCLLSFSSVGMMVKNVSQSAQLPEYKSHTPTWISPIAIIVLAFPYL